MRTSEINRNTNETEIALWIDLDGEGKASVETGVGFLDHMLELFAKHSRIDLVVSCNGDTYVDDHHSVEDIGIALGCALKEALGERRGIVRYGDTILAMDEALILTAVDLSGRAYLDYDVEIPTEKVGEFDTELVEEFLLAFVRNADITLHVIELSGKNSHHIIEGVFKSLARSLREAVAIDEEFPDEIPSTKGRLSDAPDDEMSVWDFVDEYENEDFDEEFDEFDEEFDILDEEFDEIDEEFDMFEEELDDELEEELEELDMLEKELDEELEEEEEEYTEDDIDLELPEEEAEEDFDEEEDLEEETEKEFEEEVEEAGQTIEYVDDDVAYEESFDGEPYIEEYSEEEVEDYAEDAEEAEEAEEAEDEEPVYRFTLQDLDEPEKPVYSGMGEPRLFSDDTLFGDHDDSVDDIERLAEQMARQNLSAERDAESTGLGDDEYGKELAKGYTNMDISVKELEEELSKKGLL